MIRQVLTTLLCSVTFFLIAFVIPVQAAHPFTTDFVCLTMEAGMDAAGMDAAGERAAMIQRAKTDAEFDCYMVPLGSPFLFVELVHEYRSDGVPTGLTLAIDIHGDEVYTLGTIDYIDSLLHKAETRGA